MITSVGDGVTRICRTTARPSSPGHVDVQNTQVRLQVPNGLERGLAVAHLPNDLEAASASIVWRKPRRKSG